MSSLQCPATLILAIVGRTADPATKIVSDELVDRFGDRRVAQVWTSETIAVRQIADVLASALGVVVATHRDLDDLDSGANSNPDLVGRARATLAEIADLHPGETALVLTHGDGLSAVVPSLCRMDVPAPPVGPGSTVEIEVSAEDWVCRRWDLQG